MPNARKTPCFQALSLLCQSDWNLADTIANSLNLSLSIP